MDQAAIHANDTNIIIGQWDFDETVEMDHNDQDLMEERRKFEKERKEFEQEKRAFYVQKNIEDRRIESERHLFEMKWKVLETELQKLASEKEQVEKQRNFYKKVQSFNEQTSSSGKRIIPGEMFFVGVRSEKSIRKRYKDLIKIYHPDNLGGDTGTLQEINREFDKLIQQYEA